MIKTLSLEEAQTKLPILIENTKKKATKYIITVNGTPAAILLSVDKYESMKETMEILSDPELMKAIREGEEDIKAGRVYKWEDVKKELGWDV